MFVQHNTFHLFQLVRNPGKCKTSDDKSVCYNDSDEWPAHAPVGMWIDYGLVNEFLREWCLRKELAVLLMKRETTRKVIAICGENKYIY